MIGDGMTRDRHQEFIGFRWQIDDETPADLVLHLVVDIDGIHTADHGWRGPPL